MSFIFLVQADLNESQRERFISAMNLRDVSMMDYTYLSVKQLFMELFCSTGTSVADPMMRRTQRRNFLVLDEGSLDGEDVLWVQDEETGEEGFMTLYAEDEFWVLQSNRSGGFTYRRTRVPGRQFRKPSKGFRKGKGGSGKGKGKSRIRLALVLARIWFGCSSVIICVLCVPPCLASNAIHKHPKTT